MEWKPETDVTMDFDVHSHGDERTTAVITQLTEILNFISNHLGNPIDFSEAPVTKKPTSKKVPMKGSNETDKTSLSNKTIPGMAVSQTKPKVTKANYKNNSRDFTGSTLSKENGDDYDDWKHVDPPKDDEEDYGDIERLLPHAVAGATMLYEDATDERKAVANAFTTSEGKKLLQVLTEATNMLRGFLSKTRIDNASALKPQDKRVDDRFDHMLPDNK